jgi:two-component system nitrogen regulation response regulator GlnG
MAALTRHFLSLAANEGLPRRQIKEDAIELLQRQSWRGNVRELRNFAYRLALLSREDEIDSATVNQLLADRSPADAGAPTMDMATALSAWLAENQVGPGALYHAALAAFEKPLFEHALARTGGNQLRAATLLGINRNTLRKRLSELAIDPDRFSVGN